jgi:ligand-binding sensor domain-containing protein
MLFSVLSLAQEPSYKNYDVDDGLASSFVYYVFQDSKGYIWFATEAGVSRFNGYKFENFTVDNGLSDNEVFTIYEDHKGRVWFFTFTGEPSFYHNGKMYNASNNKLLGSFPKMHQLVSFLEDSKKNIWLLPIRGPVIKVDPSDKISSHTFSTKQRYAHRSYIWENEKNEIWVAAGEAYISLDNETVVPATYPILRLGFALKQQDKSIVVSKERNLYEFKNQKESLVLNSEDVSEMKGLINCLYRDSKNRTWLGTTRELLCFEEGFTKCDRFLNDKVVASVLEDKEGNFWFATLGNGVYFSPSINIYSYTKDDGLFDNEIYSLANDASNNLWIGYKFNHYDVLFPNDSIVSHQINLERRGGRGRVLKILATATNDVWIFGDDFTSRIRDGKEETVGVPSKTGIVDSKGNTWFGNMRLLKVDEEQFQKLLKEFVPHMYLPDQQIPSKKIYDLTFDLQENLLLGTKEGLMVLKEDTIVFWNENETLLSRRINELEVDKDGTVWIATYDHGLVVMKGDQVEGITSKHGLTSNICKALLIDPDDGNVWVGTNKGLNKVIQQKNGDWKIETYTVKDGIVSNDINEIVAQNGKIWLGTGNGLSYFEKQKLNKTSKPPKVYITSFKVAEKDTAAKNGYQFPYDHNNIAIEFIGLSYRSQGDITYRYRLRGGEDATWQYTRATSVQFPALSPGKYELIIYAQNKDGVWSEKPATIRFEIMEPFWQEWWFIIASNIALIIILSLIFYARLVNQRRKNLLKERVAEAEQHALRAQMNPHFIFNALNTIQRFIVENDKKKAYNYLEKFGALIRNTLENSRKKFITISDERQMLGLYLELESKRFEDQFEYEINVDPTLSQAHSIPPMLIQPYVENSIRHGLIPKKSKGKVSINITVKDEQLMCTIEDNGIGREAALALKKSDDKHQSLGMKLTENRISLLKEEEKSDFSVNIIDLKNEEGEATGTRVEIVLPLKQRF